MAIHQREWIKFKLKNPYLAVMAANNYYVVSLI